MSEFVTVLKVSVRQVTDLLPKHQIHIHGVEFDEKNSAVKVRWSTPNLVTPFTFPIEFPIENLKARKLPKGVETREENKAQKAIRKAAEEAAKARAKAEGDEAKKKKLVAAIADANRAAKSRDDAAKAAKAAAEPPPAPPLGPTPKPGTRAPAPRSALVHQPPTPSKPTAQTKLVKPALHSAHKPVDRSHRK